MEKNLKVLMITGVYIPEHNGAVNQCRQLVLDLSHAVKFEVLCGTNQIKDAGRKIIDDILVTKVFAGRTRSFKYLHHYLNFYKILFDKLKFFDIVHIHGFSLRNAGVILICSLLRKKIILKMTSFGQDDPESIKKKSFFLWLIYKLCDFYIAISPAFLIALKKSDLLEKNYKLIPNGVNIKKFKPVSIEDKFKIRENYGYSRLDKIILFIGHFSPEKNPFFIYQSWINFSELNSQAKLILIGARSDHFEVNDSLYENIKNDLIKRNLSDSVRFISKTNCIEDYMQIADVFVMASEREGLPNVLMEAMSCGLPCIVKNLPGITDWLVNNGKSGLLFEKNDPVWLSKNINLIINDGLLRERIILSAVKFIEENFSSVNTSKDILKLYRELSNSPNITTRVT